VAAVSATEHQKLKKLNDMDQRLVDVADILRQEVAKAAVSETEHQNQKWQKLSGLDQRMVDVADILRQDAK